MKFEIPCLIYSRVVGYFQPVNQWNKGKQEEFKNRHEYTPEKIINSIEKKYASKK